MVKYSILQTIFNLMLFKKICKTFSKLQNLYINSKVKSMCVTLDLIDFSLNICCEVQWNGLYFSIYGHFHF